MSSGALKRGSICRWLNAARKVPSQFGTTPRTVMPSTAALPAARFEHVGTQKPALGLPGRPEVTEDYGLGAPLGTRAASDGRHGSIYGHCGGDEEDESSSHMASLCTGGIEGTYGDGSLCTCWLTSFRRRASIALSGLQVAFKGIFRKAWV